MRRRGFTVVEIIVAMSLTLAVFAITMPFLRTQTRALGAAAGRLDADQIARYALRAIDADLRQAAADEGQPLLVLAGPMAIAFNANLLAADTADAGARDIETGAATTLTESWRLTDAAVLPRTARAYPDQDHFAPDGGISHIETISYFLHPDTISGRSDLYVLYRRVNARDSVALVRAVHVPADSAFFSYERPVGGVLTRIAAARLPLYWDSTAIDSIRSVGIRAAGYFRERLTGDETIRTVYWTTSLPNAPGRTGSPCGNAPDAPDWLNVNVRTNSVPYRVEVEWDASDDDAGGEEDVQRYVLQWREDGGSDPWTPIATVPATQDGSYTWHHAPGRVVGSHEYGVRAIDCGGVGSPRETSGAVSLP